MLRGISRHELTVCRTIRSVWRKWIRYRFRFYKLQLPRKVHDRRETVQFGGLNR